MAQAVAQAVTQAQAVIAADAAKAEHLQGNTPLVYTFIMNGHAWTAPLRQCACALCFKPTNMHPVCADCARTEWGVEVFDTTNGKGIGVKATRKVQQGTCFPYAGEVLRPAQEAGRYLHKTAHYGFKEDGHSMIDAALVRSIASTVNHAGEGEKCNCVLRYDADGMPVVQTTIDVPADTVLELDYGAAYRMNDAVSLTRTSKSVP